MENKRLRYRGISKSDDRPIVGYLTSRTNADGVSKRYYIETVKCRTRLQEEVYANSLRKPTGLHDIAGVEVYEGDTVAPYGSDAENPFHGEIVSDGEKLVLKCDAGTFEPTQMFMEMFEVIAINETTENHE